MSSNTILSKPTKIKSILMQKCPKCREGNLFVDPNPYHFSTTMRMPKNCPVCGQLFELETGFYFGTGYVSYALSIMLIAAIFTIWAVTFKLSFNNSSIYWCLGTSISLLLMLQVVIQRISRAIWLSFFVKYDKNWRKKI